MKHLWIWVFLLCFSGHAGAQSGTADERASCHASFQQDCVPDETSTTSSSGFAAPAGLLGSSWLEVGLVLLMIAGGIARRLPIAAKRLILDGQGRLAASPNEGEPSPISSSEKTRYRHGGGKGAPGYPRGNTEQHPRTKQYG
jgi:hypothetical protein